MRDKINALVKRAKHPFNRLWKWAHGHGPARWNALAHWARHQAEIQRKAGHGAKAKQYAQAAEEYGKRKRTWLDRHAPSDPPPQGNLVTFDGHQVPAWMVNSALAPARASGTWTGVVYSGFRTPEYSTSLCEAMCGAPTCPGRCAGANSNHSCPPSHTGVPYEGAVDVSDPVGLQYWVSGHGYPIRHTLPSDANHFSRTGQ